VARSAEWSGNADCRLPDRFHDSHFLGSWRSTLIIATSIPLAILTSIIAFSAIGETINIMTLGGLALAVGILVDDATVEVENINRNREAEPEKDMDEVVLDSASQIATPAFVSTLSICIVFAPMFLLSGVARYLFVPLAEAVVFAMLASYFLSRTIVPTMAKYLLRGEKKRPEMRRSRNPLVRLQKRFEDGLREISSELSQPAGDLPPSPACVPDCVLRVLSRLSGNSDSLAGPGLLPQR
jgi:multidrug efflux pump subunit AcrB